jgi:sugar/nucleoside kinase (ribokinase family)
MPEPTSRFDRILGVGGIGVGSVYRLEGDATLGREESRPARLLDIVDRCKLHIILHYVAVMLRDLCLPVEVSPIGMVGDDPEGRRLLGEMRRAGMATGLVRRLSGQRTQTSICLQYPDGSGGNITETGGAAARLGVRSLAATAMRLTPRTLVLAAPEVPLAVRLALIARAHRRGAFVVASFTSQEFADVRVGRALGSIDLLALNLHEARSLAGASERLSAKRVVDLAGRRLLSANPRARLSVTDGGRGSYLVTGAGVHQLPGLRVPVANTAGAGDAYVAGMILAEALAGPEGAEPAASCAMARAIAAFSVTSRDTVHQNFSLTALRAFARRYGVKDRLIWT